jgi:hypothetical protein
VLLGIAFAVAVWLRLRSVESTSRIVTATDVSTPADATASTPGYADPADPLATATMAEADPVTGKAVASTTNGMSTREQRYQELLRSAPPAPAQVPAPPAAEKSLLQRMASAIGLGGENRKPAGPAPNAPQPPRPLPAQQQQQASNKTPQAAEPKKPAEELDPESDTRPPQLVNLQFNPPQVQDGEVTTLYINAQDDLSGIRTISGVIANPTGATVSGFAAQLEPETNRYTARIVVPKDAAEGNWHIKYLTMSDKAANQVNLAYGQGLIATMATFRVTSSRSDSKGPELGAISVDKRSMSAGDKNTIFVQATDDKAGVQLVSGVFVSPSKQARLGFGCRDNGNQWDCTLTVPECVDCGLWQLEQIQLQDKANNTTTVRVDNPMVQQIQVDISGDRCDGAAPVLTSLALQPLVVSNQEESRITVNATIQDDNCGGATLSGLATGPQGQRLNIIFEPSKDGQSFTGRIDVGKNQAKGRYAITWIQALDKGQNLKAYSANEPVVGRVSFEVE